MDNTLTAGRGRAGAILVASALSNQLGAASGSLAFPAIGPVGVVAARQLIAAAVLLPLVRPRIFSFTRHQWWPILLLALVFGTMNLSLYAAVERIGLGLAVTLEFLGPLALALIGSRTKASAACALLAAAGVVAITQPEASTDYVGIGLGLVAACSWAAYILLNRTVGKRIPGIQGTAAATGVSAALFLPVGLVTFLNHRPDAFTVLCAAGAGVLASVVPYVADVITLRRIPTSLFGVLMSINPVFAALVGALALGEALGIVQWAGIFLIAAANAALTAGAGRRPPVSVRRSSSGPPPAGSPPLPGGDARRRTPPIPR
ncbi:EamA family transporter [Pseudarthrobacter sp.]|uniref:EamA family transporter n=1 Tax=Pseudarthrobacter sp. TaxID=1934409 RepID=UPI002FC86D94